MLAALKYKDIILENFYLGRDDLTIHHSKDCVRGKFKKGSIVIPYILRGNKWNDYKGINIPGVDTSISLPWVLTVLREVEFDDGMVVDHIDGDITNNSRDNLRVITQQENCKNRRKHKNNTSGYTGISYHKGSGRYVVRRTINGKRIWKSSKTLEGAIEILKELEQEGLKDGYTERHGK